MVWLEPMSLVKVQVRVPASHVPTDAQSPPVASSVMVNSAKASGIIKIPIREILEKWHSQYGH